MHPPTRQGMTSSRARRMPHQDSRPLWPPRIKQPSIATASPVITSARRPADWRSTPWTSRRPAATRRGVGRGRAQAAHAARCRRRACRGRTQATLRRADRRWLETELDRAAAQPQPGPSAAPPPEPRRVRQRHPRPARARRRRRVAAAARRLGVRLRQHRRPARRLAGAARALPRRRPIASARSRSAIRRRRRRSETYRVTRSDQSQDQHIEGLPLGTVGGLVVRTRSRSTASTQFQLELFRTNLEAIRGLEHPHQLEITRGRRARVPRHRRRRRRGRARAGQRSPTRSDAIDARLQVRVPVKAGPRAVGATLRPQDRRGHEPAAAVPAQQRRHLRLHRPAARRDADDHRAVQRRRARATRRAAAASSSCRPADGVARRSGVRDARFSSTLARRAYRRPVTDARPRRALLRVLSRRAARRGASTPASSWRCGACWRARRSCSASRTIRRSVGAGRRSTASATSSWRRGCRSSSGAASRTTSCSTLAAAGPAATAGGARGAGAAHAGRPARRRAGRELRRAVAAPPQPAEHRAELRRVPRLRRRPAPGASGARPSCSSPASCARTATSSTC